MREMKDSGVEWIGEIPKEWHIVKIKYLPDKTINNSYTDGDWIESPDVADEGIRYLTTGNIGDGKYKDQGKGFITLETFNRLNCKYAYPGDLIISRLNAPYGRSCILPNDYSEYVLAVDNVILRPTENKKYICYISQCDGYQHSVEDVAKGTTMKRISRTNLGNIFLPIPAKEEQECIVEYLDAKCSKIDEIIEKQQAIIEKLKEYKLSIITEAVTKGINPNVEIKDSGIEWIGYIPKCWNISRFKYLSSEIGDGLHSTPVYDSEGDYYFMNGQNIGNEKLVFSDKTDRLNELEYMKYKKPLLSENTIFITLNGATYGKSSFYNGEKVLLGKSAGYITLKSSENKRYIRYYLQSRTAKIFMELSLCGSTIANLSLKTLNEFIIPLPSEDEQRRIVDFLDVRCKLIDHNIDEKGKIVEKLQEYKKSLIYEVVTGKKEV